MTEDKVQKGKLSQWDALLLESLRGQGWTEQELLQRVQDGNLPKDESEFEFDYRRLTELQAEDPDGFRQAVYNGYRIKYNTIRGISSWIKVALGKEAMLELTEGKEAVEARLAAEEIEHLSGVLSIGWHLTKTSVEEDGYEYYVVIKPDRSA
ncbi:hypothetical protein [Gorillibacterium sp. sgz500922]|uniref:hypothetical protein n=1 Tax=Gorillibacterium sp. sgz500922 TaxID=3446694 RepID=UPI003F672A4C